MQKIRFAAMTVLAVSTLSACATKGFVRKGLDEQRMALSTERSQRMAGDDSLRTKIDTEVGALRTDLNALRNDLGALRNEFGARITAMENQVKFAMPVHFGFDDAAVRQQDEAALERFAQVASNYYKGANITIEGFADPAGSAAYNLRLSRERADAVRDFLVSKGLDGATLRTVGYGKTRLVKPGAKGDEAGAELNRRVVFVVETPAGMGTATVAAMSGNE
ncbi:MAG: OmpA family protein [Gemmatimonadaceae bacterium]|jgi:peptidoglycan-associated lipoprotein|nr:OmpA family protein [Gemmatimonadaceae bacterium]MBX9854595.1 OmpA family protein [Gemmatimonadaceae bacterium]